MATTTTVMTTLRLSPRLSRAPGQGFASRRRSVAASGATPLVRLRHVSGTSSSRRMLACRPSALDGAEGTASSSEDAAVGSMGVVGAMTGKDVLDVNAKSTDDGIGGLSGGGQGNGGDRGRGGGGGGSGGGDSEHEPQQSVPPSMSQKLTLVYAALVGVGGLVGFLKTGSTKSLLSGGTAAFILYYVYTQLPVNPVTASYIGTAISAVLLVAMGSRFKNSGKLFPAGLVSLVSFVMTGGYIHGIMRGSHHG